MESFLWTARGFLREGVGGGTRWVAWIAYKTFRIYCLAPRKHLVNVGGLLFTWGERTGALVREAATGWGGGRGPKRAGGRPQCWGAAPWPRARRQLYADACCRTVCSAHLIVSLHEALRCLTSGCPGLRQSRQSEVSCQQARRFSVEGGCIRTPGVWLLPLREPRHILPLPPGTGQRTQSASRWRRGRGEPP